LEHDSYLNGRQGGCQISFKNSKNPIGGVNRTNIDEDVVKGTKNKRSIDQKLDGRGRRP
jgi:hypothetical protein